MAEDLIGALRLDGDQLAVRLERRYGTDPADLWSALTDPARLIRWFAQVEGDLRPGGRFRIHFDANDPDDHTVGVVRDCEPPHRLVVTWHFRDENESMVRADLVAERDGTRLILEHRKLPAGAAAGYGAGWQTYFEQLGAYLSGQAGRGGQWDSRWEQLMPGYRAQLAALEH